MPHDQYQIKPSVLSAAYEKGHVHQFNISTNLDYRRKFFLISIHPILFKSIKSRPTINFSYSQFFIDHNFFLNGWSWSWSSILFLKNAIHLELINFYLSNQCRLKKMSHVASLVGVWWSRDCYISIHLSSLLLDNWIGHSVSRSFYFFTYYIGAGDGYSVI